MTTTYVITGDWLCDQEDILCDDANVLSHGAVLCDGIGVAVPDDLPVNRTNSPLDKPKLPHTRADSPGVYRRKK